MTRNIYWMMAFSFAMIMLLILKREKKAYNDSAKAGRAFHIMLYVMLFLCLQDVLWGLCYSGVIDNYDVFFASTGLFHASCIASAYAWLNFAITFLHIKEKMRRGILIGYGVFFVIELALVAANYGTPLLFTIEDGQYVPQSLRLLTFALHHIAYLLVALHTLGCLCKFKKWDASLRLRYWGVWFSALASLSFCVAQYLYPDAPFFSLSAIVSSLIVYIYVVSQERDRLVKSKAQFLRNITHEIRTSTNSVYGFAQLLSIADDTLTQEEHETYGAHIRSSYSMLEMLLNDLAIFTQLDQRGLSIRREKFSVDTVCQNALQAVGTCKPEKVTFHVVNHLPDGFTVKTDPERLQLILQNMLTDACQFTQHGDVRLEIRQDSRWLEFSVTIIGQRKREVRPGSLMAQDDDSFGLRYQVCRQMAELIGGRVYSDDEHPDGTRRVFTIRTSELT